MEPLLLDMDSIEVLQGVLDHYNAKIGFFAEGPDKDLFTVNLAYMQGRIPVAYAAAESTKLTVIRDKQQYFITNMDDMIKFVNKHQHPHF